MPESFASQALNIGSNSVSSSSSAPIAGQPNATASYGIHLVCGECIRCEYLCLCACALCALGHLICHCLCVTCAAPVYNCQFYSSYALNPSFLYKISSYISINLCHAATVSCRTLLPCCHSRSIDVSAFFILCKQFYGLTFVAVDLPASGAFKIPACIFNKANDISQRIAKKNSDLMWKSFLPQDWINVPLNVQVASSASVSAVTRYLIPCKKCHHARLSQIYFPAAVFSGTHRQVQSQRALRSKMTAKSFLLPSAAFQNAICSVNSSSDVYGILNRFAVFNDASVGEQFPIRYSSSIAAPFFPFLLPVFYSISVCQTLMRNTRSARPLTQLHCLYGSALPGCCCALLPVLLPVPSYGKPYL